MSFDGTLIGDVLEELKSRESYKATVYAPYYMASVACHWFNLHNQKTEIYWESRTKPSMRLHLLFVAPPGFMKTYFLEVMLRGDYCILGTTVRKTFEAVMTEAGLIGTIRSTNGEVFIEEGAAKEYADGIIGVDEFSAITRMMQTTHSGQLDTQLLSALDSGWCYKRLAMGKFEYKSEFSMWGGVQPARFDLTSGMGRRFCYLLFLPTRKEADELLDAWFRSKNIRPDKQEMDTLWRKLKQFHREIETIKSLEFDPNILKEYKELGIFPYEGTIFDRLIMGLTLLKGVHENVEITLRDHDIRNFVTQELAWRRQISFGSEYRQVIKILEEHNGTVIKSRILQDLFMLGWDLDKVVEVLNEMKKLNLISMTKDQVMLI